MFFILKWAGFAFAAWFLWGLRNWIRKPWAEYISHSKLKDGTLIVKARHWSVLPPWSQYERTWFSHNSGFDWYEERSGRQPEYSCEKALKAMFDCAEARKRETEELIGGGL